MKSVRKMLRLVGSAVLLGLLAWRTDWRQVWAALHGVRAGGWLMAVALYAATQVVSSLRWRLLAQPLGFRQGLGQFVAFYYVGMFFNLVLPTSVGGDMVRAWYLDGGSGRKGTALVSVLADRVSGLLMLLAIACTAVAVAPLDLSEPVRRTVYGLTGAGLAGLVVLLLLGRYSVLRTPHSGPLAKLLAAARELQTALLPRPRLLLLTTLLSMVIQAANVILVWLLGQALALDVPALYYAILVPTVTLMTLLPVSLNGMGVREWGTVLLLAPLGIAPGAATALAFLWFLTFAAVSLAGAGFYLLGQFSRFEVRSDDKPVGRGSDQGREGQPRAAA